MSRSAMVRAAVGILEDSRGNVLLQLRGDRQACAGQWEFPGGKIKTGETPAQALARELLEELGVEAARIVPWIRRTHQYPHCTCTVDFMRVLFWNGDPSGQEGQRVCWVQVRREIPPDLLEANLDVWKWLRLPRLCAISSIESIGMEAHLQRWKEMQKDGLRMIQVRDKGLDGKVRRLVLEKTVVGRKPESLVLYNGDERTARSLGASGIHLDSRSLARVGKRPDFEWVGASCHDGRELARAHDLGLDYALLSPVKPTDSHPEAAPLGWARFARLAENAGIPVYALGGVEPEDLSEALSHGAHGIAGIRAFTSPRLRGCQAALKRSA